MRTAGVPDGHHADRAETQPTVSSVSPESDDVLHASRLLSTCSEASRSRCDALSFDSGQCNEAIIAASDLKDSSF